MSETLEKLYSISQKLDEDLADIYKGQKELREKIDNKRAARWEEMFEDLYKLSKYSRFLDTGIPLYRGETIGFEVRATNIIVISFSHLYPEPATETYFFAIYKDKPFDAHNSIYERWMEYVLQAAENWSEVKQEMEKRLEEKMKRDMAKKIADAETTQKKLEQDLRAIS